MEIEFILWWSWRNTFKTRYVNFADEQCTCGIWCFEKHYSDSHLPPMLKGKWCSSGWCLKQIVQVTRVMLWKGLWGLQWQELVRHQTWTCRHGQLLCHNSPNTENEAAKRSHAPGRSWAKRLCPMSLCTDQLDGLTMCWWQRCSPSSRCQFIKWSLVGHCLGQVFP